MVLALIHRTNWVERLALGGAILYVAHLVSRYDLCFQDGEVFGYHAAALKNGTTLHWRDLGTAFDVWGLDGDFRPRVLSYLAFIVTLKTRLALWHVVQPHPSFTPVWLLTMGVAPVLLYRFLRLELRDPAAAFAGVAIYLVSAGFLSGVTMIFHLGKPLANALVIGVFYLCARINAAPVPSARLVGALLALLTLAPFVDETGVFAWIIPLVWCGYCRRRWMVFATPAAIDMVLIFVAAPVLARLLFDGEFDFLDYLRRMASEGEWGGDATTRKLTLYRTLRHAANLLIPGLLPWQMAIVSTPIADLRPVPVVAFALLGAAGVAATWIAGRSAASWVVYRKLAMLAALFVVFQSIVVVFHDIELSATGYYYGAIFSIVFAGLAAAVYAGFRGSPAGVAAARLVLVWVLAISAINFLSLNAMWMRHSNDKAIDMLPIVFRDRAAPEWQALETHRAEIIARGANGYEDDVRLPSPRPPAERVRVLWNQWRANPADFTGGAPLTVRDLWLVLELTTISDRMIVSQTER